MRRAATVWVAAGATRFSCICESCLDAADRDGSSFLAAVGTASVTGPLGADATVVSCAAGHRLVVRRLPRSPTALRQAARRAPAGARA